MKLLDLMNAMQRPPKPSKELYATKLAEVKAHPDNVELAKKFYVARHPGTRVTALVPKLHQLDVTGCEMIDDADAVTRQFALMLCDGGATVAEQFDKLD